VAVRQTARALTQMYDEALEPVGLSIGQYSLLAALYYSDATPVKKLASRLQMDRTSLTRALAPLERERLLIVKEDPADGRSRLISLTPAGLDRLVAAYPLWERAQKQMVKGFKQTDMARFRVLLDQASEVASAPTKAAAKPTRAAGRTKTRRERVRVATA